MRKRPTLYLPLETHVDNTETLAFAMTLVHKFDYRIELLFEEPEEYVTHEFSNYSSITAPKNEIMLYMLYLKGAYKTHGGWNSVKNVKFNYSIGESLINLIEDKKDAASQMDLFLLGPNEQKFMNSKLKSAYIHQLVTHSAIPSIVIPNNFTFCESDRNRSYDRAIDQVQPFNLTDRQLNRLLSGKGKWFYWN
ncbi:MAG: hypothetical protein MRY83_22185 [Flavobacteriales bacterium]|nr:hypothetical protein [Flavobacteriales bacterium]